MEEIEQVIRNGTENMPAGLLTDDAEIKAMARYIDSFKYTNLPPKPFDKWFAAFQDHGYKYVGTGSMKKDEEGRFQIEVKVTDGSGQTESWTLIVVDFGNAQRKGVYRVDGIEGGPAKLSNQ
jgi:hypothetical protein